MAGKEEYKTQPLECYPKAKEIMRSHWQDIMTAHEQGRPLIHGSVMEPMAIVAGIGDYAYHPGGPYAVNVSTSHDFCMQALEACEARGFARDVCGYFHCDLGSVYLNRYLFGGGFPKPDLCIMIQDCEARANWGQASAEHFNIPLFMMDLPFGPSWERVEQRVEYLANQFHELIEWLEKVTGKEYDDEKLIQAVYDCIRIRKLWSEITLLTAHIPSPLDTRMTATLQSAPMWRQHHRETLELLEMVKHETQHRIDSGIAAVVPEQCRLMMDNMPPWPAHSQLRQFTRQFGVVLVAMYIYTAAIGTFERLPDGTMLPARTLEERGIVLKNREDAVQAMADHSIREWMYTNMWYIPDRLRDTVQLAKQLNVDGVILHLNRACPGVSVGVPDIKRGIQRAGIPVTSFEAAGVDIREINVVEIMDCLERFMDVLGVKRVQD